MKVVLGGEGRRRERLVKNLFQKLFFFFKKRFFLSFESFLFLVYDVICLQKWGENRLGMRPWIAVAYSAPVAAVSIQQCVVVEKVPWQRGEGGGGQKRFMGGGGGGDN